MPSKSKTNAVHKEKGPTPSALTPEVRHWISAVIVPILVEQFLQQKPLPPEEIDG
jgi:hypothetical protein